MFVEKNVENVSNASYNLANAVTGLHCYTPLAKREHWEIFQMPQLKCLAIRKLLSISRVGAASSQQPRVIGNESAVVGWSFWTEH